MQIKRLLSRKAEQPFLHKVVCKRVESIVFLCFSYGSHGLSQLELYKIETNDIQLFLIAGVLIFSLALVANR